MEFILGVAIIGFIVYKFTKKDGAGEKSPAPAKTSSVKPLGSTRTGRGTEQWSPSSTWDENVESAYRPRRRIPFAQHGMQGPLFDYALAAGSGRHEHVGDFAILDFETTGLSPEGGDRIIEVAVARVDRNGRILDEFATLVNPEGRDTGPVFIHRITNEAVAEAPTFSQVAPELLRRLDGAVVVAHNAPFEEHFLSLELAAAGYRGLRFNTICTLLWSQETMRTPNHKLATVAQAAGVEFPAKHAALSDVRAVAGLMPILLEKQRGAVRFSTPTPRQFVPESGLGVTWKPITRAPELRKGTTGWMSSIVSRLPMSGMEGDDSVTEAYLDALSEALADGKIIGEEAKALAKLAGAAGLGAAQVSALNAVFLEGMREAALEDGILTSAELRDLKRAAANLAVPEYFDDLEPTPAKSPRSPSGTVSSTNADPAKKVSQRRCGHCRTPGHYRNTCPELEPA